MKLADLYVKLGIKKEGFDKGIKQAKTETNSFGASMKKIGGIIAGAFAVGAIIRYSKIFLEKFNIQKQAETQLLVALKGRKFAQQELIDQAQKLQKITLFGDEDTIRAEALIAAFVKEKDQIKAIIPLVQDFASAKMMSLAGAADLVSKTLGSSTNALSRYGIEVKGTVGSVDRLHSLMDGLSKAFEGQAKAAAEAGTGGIKQFSNAIGDLEEKMGSFLANRFNLVLIKALTKLVGGLAEIKNKLTKFSTSGTLTKDWLSSASVKDLNKELAITTEQFKVFKRSYEQAKAEGNTDKSGFYAGAMDIARQNLEGLNAALKEKGSGTTILTKSVTEAEASEIALKDAKKALDDFMAKGGTFKGEASAQAYIDKMEKLKAAIKAAQEQYDKFHPSGRQSPIDSMSTFSMGDVGTDQIGAGDMGNMNESGIDYNAPYLKRLAAAKQFTTELNNIISQGIGDAITTMAEGFGELAAGAIAPKDFGLELLKMVGDFMVKFGSLMIAYAIAASGLEAAIKNPGMWPVALAAGIALVAIGGAISGLAKKGLSGGGGSSYVPAASGYSPHQSNAGSVINGNVVFQLEGTTLKGVLDNTDRQNNLIR